MKNLIAVLSLLVLVGVTHGQNRMTESELIGTWKMTIEIDKVMEEIEKESEKEENLLAKVILKSVSGLVGGVLDNMDIYIKLKKGGDAIIKVTAFGEESDEEDSRWYIKGNKLFIEDTRKNDFDWESDDYWVMKDGVLVLESDDDKDVSVYMVKI